MQSQLAPFIKFFGILAIFCCCSMPCLAGFVFNENCKNIYKDVLALRIQNARLKLAEEKKLHATNTLVYYLENYADFLEAVITEEESFLAAFKTNSSSRLKMIEKEDTSSPYCLFAQAEMYLQMAIVRLKCKEFITAAYDIRKSFKLAHQNAILYPGFEPNNKIMGFLHAMIGTVPDDYKWIVGIGGLKGTVDQGIEELNRLINAKSVENPGYCEEALIIKAFLVLNLKNDKVAANAMALQLAEANKENANLLLSFVCSNIALRTGRNDQAIKILMARSKKDNLPFYYLDYLTGVAKLNRMDVDADLYFKKFIQNFKGKNYVKSAYQKLAWHSLVHGEEEKYHIYLKTMLTNGTATVDEDVQAEKEAVTGMMPNVTLLKARLFSDGGYYQRAVAAIASNKIPFNRLKDQLEVTYRMGRICQEEGLTTKAIDYYLSTVKNGQSYSFYYAANAALQLGLIYELQGDLMRARLYYKICLSMKNHEYQYSLDHKAKAGLDRVN
jgi:hypothetical protein